MSVFNEVPISEFFEDYCVFDNAARTRTMDLLNSYHAWCIKYNTLPVKQREFYKLVESRGVTRRRSTGNYPFFFGIRLKSGEEDAP